MKTYILTDLTRFSKPDKVCIALIDPMNGQCFRPIPYLTSKACAKLGIQPGAKIIGELDLKRNNSRPHVEDASYGKLKFGGPSTAKEFRDVLEMTLSPNVSEGFGVSLDQKQKHIPDETPALKSILTIKAQPNQIQIHEDQYKPGKIKLSFQDSSGHHFPYLSITDRGFYDFAEKHQNDSQLINVQRLLASQDEIYLRVGLGRSFEVDDGRKGCWLQVNGIYSFPNYRKEIRQYGNRDQ
jgi:hypothetical protein